MLIHSGLVTLQYDPTTDILKAELPELKQLALSEVSHCLELVVDALRSYDIKYLLLDARNTVIDLEGEGHREVIHKFVLELSGTRLKKMARVGTLELGREIASARLSQELSSPIPSRSFTVTAAALEWLSEP